MPSLGDRLKHAWNAFTNQDRFYGYQSIGAGSSFRPDLPRMTRGSEQSILNGIITRISIDVASVQVQHVRLDQNGGYSETIDDSLNYCLTTEANVDQTSREFMRSAVSMMLDEGHVAIVPTKTNIDPKLSTSYEVQEVRAGKVVAWYPQHVRVDLYNEHTGRHDELVLPKKVVAIVYNPFYSVMNEPNSTLQRLKRKLVILDAIDEQSGAGKLDLLVQLPYALKSDARRQQADIRRKEIERQLEGTKYGIAYIDSTEKVTQLNRSVENNLMNQIEYLTGSLYGQLGITQEIINGTADEQTMLNYNNRTVEPILSAIVDEEKRKFLTKTARTQGQSILFFRDPFRLAPVSQIAELADKLTRNEIMSPNEFRVRALGYKAVDDERANELRNRNLNQDKDAEEPPTTDTSVSVREAENKHMQQSGFLSHYGIEGMKWGVRNGPPYPLDKKETEVNSPEKLQSYMADNIKYSQFTTLKSPEQVEKDKSGDCHSQSLYEIEKLKKQGLSPKASFFIEYDPSTNQGGQTHTFVYYNKDGKTYWFENSWGGQEGIHEYSSEKALFNDIRKKHMSEQTKDRKHFSELEFADFNPSDHEIGESLQDLVNRCFK